MIKINNKGQNIFVYHNQEPIGFIHYFTNVFHKNNLYLEFHLKEYNLDDSLELFKEIEHSFSMQLQVMLYENELDIIRFLKHAGFELKRKCFEYVVGEKDLKRRVFSNGSLEKITYLDLDYKFCVENLYNKYKENHEDISPLTATVEEFSKDLPKEVFIQKDKDKMNHFAFIEENEIAYIGSLDNSQMDEFLSLVIETLFKTYDTIEFETDHNDKEMNLLKDCFYPQKCISYDTYIKTYKK